MIRGITVSRANVAPAVCDPVQWSANSQLAINNSQSLTILEPILPSIHQSIIPNPKTPFSVLDSKSLFDVKNVIHAEVISSWELRKFLNIEVTTYDEPLHFGKFADPLIVSHKWTTPSPYTKNANITILLNTSELLVLERATVKSDYYTIKHNFFEILLQNLRLTSDHFTDKGEIKITKSQLLSLKVTSFEYDESGYLSLALANNTISIFDTELRNVVSTPIFEEEELGIDEECIVKLSWSSWQGNTSRISVTTSSNSIILITVQRKSGALSVTSRNQIRRKSRFLVSRTQWTDDGNYLFIGDTTNFQVYVTRTNSLVAYNHSLTSKNQFMTGIIVSVGSNSTLAINLSFENGKFEQVLFDTVDESIKKQINSKTSPLEKLVKQQLYKYQLSNSASISESKNNYNYLNEIVEGNYINYGTKSNGQVIALVSRIVPKNVINYTILSKVDYQIDFIPVSNFNDTTVASPFDFSFSNFNSYTSVLSWVNSFLFNNFDRIPQVKQIDVSNVLKFNEEIVQLLEQFDFKTDFSLKPISKTSDLESLVWDNFINDQNIFRLQLKYNLLTIFLKSLKVLHSKFNNESLDVQIQTFEEDIRGIIDIIFNRLGDILHAISIGDNDDPYNSFLKQSYEGLTNTKVQMEVDDSATISIKTQFLTESFQAGGNSREEITSLTNHKWKRCNLTLFPMLQLNHKTSELGGFDYIIDSFGDESWLLKDILKYFDFCIYTGNRTFKKK
ncbi:hypothetical protein CLIB1423_04S00166 [[Candida] railenensis]|uniref:Transcription factor IIIC 90kDa subunit N-terminal domain-containing protein n=1 Tax=[Candida] railenensis TaxID=45579 RepID=A0A9P0QN02_9ASCO|nr:hypothetical protein CLIB1423_04S00166 [[Candida] railenensis]